MKITVTQIIYKRVKNINLNVRFFSPSKEEDGKYPLMIFFFGGGWNVGSIDQFTQQSKYFTSLGIICAPCEYRIKSVHNTTPYDSLKDANEFIIWVKHHAYELNIDPNKIIVSGGSAGGHLAACTGTLDENSLDIKAMVLFNPVLDMTHVNFVDDFGCDAKEISPIHHISNKTANTIIFHGKSDDVVPINS